MLSLSTHHSIPFYKRKPFYCVLSCVCTALAAGIILKGMDASSESFTDPFEERNFSNVSVIWNYSSLEGVYPSVEASEDDKSFTVTDWDKDNETVTVECIDSDGVSKTETYEVGPAPQLVDTSVQGASEAADEAAQQALISDMDRCGYLLNYEENQLTITSFHLREMLDRSNSNIDRDQICVRYDLDLSNGTKSATEVWTAVLLYPDGHLEGRADPGASSCDITTDGTYVWYR